MGILSKNDIDLRLERSITDKQSLVITPLLEKDKSLDYDSIDLRLGTHFLLPQVPPEPYYLPGRTKGTSHLKVYIPLGDYLVLPAHHTVLGVTLEYIKLPFDLSGQILTKSSTARTFTVIETAPWVHPNYRGCLTLEIANVSNTPIILCPGRLIGQLILMTVDNPEEPKQLSGSYISPTYPESPRFNDPVIDLGRIGIKTGKVFDKLHGK